jgi:hypothetical protein
MEAVLNEIMSAILAGLWVVVVYSIGWYRGYSDGINYAIKKLETPDNAK